MIATEQAQWNIWGATPERWADLKLRAVTARKVWFFTKGPSFNEKFDWSQVDHEKDFKIACNDAACYVQKPDLVLTRDNRIREYLFEQGFRDVMISALRSDWPQVASSGDYALMVCGELGITKMHAVGLDHSYGNGFPYKFASGGSLPVNQTLPNQKKHKKCCEGILKKYNITLL